MILLLRKIILVPQIVLGLAATLVGIMLWYGSMDFKYIGQFLALLSLFTGCIIFTSCTSGEINTMKTFFATLGVSGLLAGIGSALVFWQYLPADSWYYFNLILVLSISFSLFAETEKGRKLRSVVHVVASIIIFLTLFLMLMHVLGWVKLKLMLLILLGAIGLLVAVVILRNRKSNQSPDTSS